MPDLDQIKQAEQVHCRCRGECQSGGAEPARQRHAIPEPDRHFGDGSHDGGVDRHLAYDVLTNSLFDSRVHKTYGGKIVDEQYSPPGMAVPLATKDLRLALAEAERAAVPMPAASLVHDRLVGMAARGWEGLDWSALGLLAAVDAGLNEGR
jgi:NADP-dependent 3-hydroxyisobutyrate dehydrogenase-like protein